MFRVLSLIVLIADKKLGRGISRANDENVSLVTKARKELAMDFHTKQEQQASPFVDTPDYTFTLPDLSVHEDENFRYARQLSPCDAVHNCFTVVGNFWRKI